MPDRPTAKFYKVIACEIAVREICRVAATSSNIVDLEFLPQGYHDTPAKGRVEVQKRIDSVPAGKYDAILLGYGLCSSILTGLRTSHTPLVVPRAHDCITFFLGSKELYQEFFDANPGTYYYTSGWLECARRRMFGPGDSGSMFLPAQAQAGGNSEDQNWVQKYGEEKAKFLLEAMGEWTSNYTAGHLIDFDFTRALKLREQVQKVCCDRGWEYRETEGNLGLLERLLGGEWKEQEVLVVRPGEKIVPIFDGKIIGTEPE